MPAREKQDKKSFLESKLKEKILAKLSEVLDPELGIDIVNLGLIYGVEINFKEKKGRVKFTATTPMCPLLGEILMNIQQKLSEIKELDEISVELVWDPPWTRERMSKKAKEMLGFE